MAEPAAVPVPSSTNGASDLPTSTAVAQPFLHLPSSTDPRKLTTQQAVKRALSEANAYGTALDEQITSAVESAKTRIAASQQSIASLAPQIELLTEEADVLQSRLSDAAITSDRISGAVRLLDENRRRVRQASQWVSWTQDLKSSLASLASAIDEADWDAATRQAQRAMAVPVEVTESEFARKTVPSTEQPLPPAQTLENLRKILLDVFTTKFNEATREQNEPQASRFFKLFPQVGWRNQGLSVYCDFARGIIREKGKAILDATTRGASLQLHHPQLLTVLFEQLALLIDTHQAVVDRHYGKGNFAAGVMPGLQAECDYIGSRVVDHWVEKTAIHRRCQEAKAYAFGFLANLGSAGASADSRSGIKAPGGLRYGLPGRPATPSGSATRPGTPSSAMPATTEEAQIPDGREVDRLLGELATMAARWATYRRFLRARLNNTLEDDQATTSRDHQSSPDEGEGELKDFRRSSIDGQSRPRFSSSVDGPDDISAEPITADKVLEKSTLGQKLDHLLQQVYSPLEKWYLRSSLEKAHKLDKPDHNSRPWTSSVLDDSFFLIRSTLSRLLSTSHLPVLETMLKAIRTMADEDYVQVLVRRMEMTWRNVGGALAGPDGPRKETATREMRTQFVLYLNVLSTSARYSSRILADLSSEGNISQHFSTRSELSAVSTLLADLSALPSRCRSASQTELEHLFNTLTRPRLKAMLNDAYRDVTYNITSDDEFVASEEADLVAKRLMRGIEHHLFTMNAFKECFTEENWEAYFSLVVEGIVRPWEKLILGTTSSTGGVPQSGATTRRFVFTELGALRFDKDWRSMASFLATMTASGEVRDKFARLQQIAYVLSLDDEEVTREPGGTGADPLVGAAVPPTDQGIYNQASQAGFSWRLSAIEVTMVRNLRVS